MEGFQAGKQRLHCDLRDRSGCCPVRASQSLGLVRGQRDEGTVVHSKDPHLHLFMTLSHSG